MFFFLFRLFLDCTGDSRTALGDRLFVQRSFKARLMRMDDKNVVSRFLFVDVWEWSESYFWSFLVALSPSLSIVSCCAAVKKTQSICQHTQQRHFSSPRLSPGWRVFLEHQRRAGAHNCEIEKWKYQQLFFSLLLLFCCWLVLLYSQENTGIILVFNHRSRMGNKPTCLRFIFIYFLLYRNMFFSLLRTVRLLLRAARSCVLLTECIYTFWRWILFL